jgi:hypothetical protein
MMMAEECQNFISALWITTVATVRGAGQGRREPPLYEEPGGGGKSVPQTHSTIRDGKRLVWYTENLWAKARLLVPFEVAVSSIKELDEDCWYCLGKKPTLRAIARHCQRINTATFEHPIILNDDGSLMDGGHRLCRALLEGRETIRAVRFERMPDPDEIHELRG